jgi:hypothetical protein
MSDKPTAWARIEPWHVENAVGVLTLQFPGIWGAGALFQQTLDVVGKDPVVPEDAVHIHIVVLGGVLVAQHEPGAQAEQQDGGQLHVDTGELEVTAACLYKGALPSSARKSRA